MNSNQNSNLSNRIIFPNRLLILFASLCLFIACASKPKQASNEEQQQKLTEALEQGYKASQNLLIVNNRAVWTHDNVEIDTLLTVPNDQGHFPLIIYLPSLGEDAAAGQLWRETWAKAGYAVFSLQLSSIERVLKDLGSETGQAFTENNDADNEIENKPTEFDAKHKKSKSARNSELRFLGHELFAVEGLKNRMQQLFWTFQQLKYKANSSDQSIYSKIDLSKIILAGYDLGAQTVAGVIGENFSSTLPTSSELHPLAAIILSPSIDLAEGNVRSRFQNISLPLLVATGTEDNDPYAISSASVRAAIWEFSPAGSKYLLLMSGNVHPLLAGSNLGGQIDTTDDDQDTGFWGLGNLGGNKLTPDALQYNQGGGHGSKSRYGKGIDKDSNILKELSYKQVAAVSSTTTAFLDKIAKNDEFAQFWLNDKANVWLENAGTLKIR